MTTETIHWMRLDNRTWACGQWRIIKEPGGHGKWFKVYCHKPWAVIDPNHDPLRNAAGAIRTFATADGAMRAAMKAGACNVAEPARLYA